MSTWRVFVILLALLASSQASDKKTDGSASHRAASKTKDSPSIDFSCTPHKGGSPGPVAPMLEKDFDLTVEAKVKRVKYVE